MRVGWPCVNNIVDGSGRRGAACRMADFQNNLRVSDKVFDVVLKRNGLVSVVSEGKRLVKVIFDGNKNAKTCDVSNLRLVVSGKPEDVPPFEGTLPIGQAPKAPRPTAHPAVQLVAVTPLESLETKLAANNTRRDVIQKEYVALGHENGRIENAIAALKAV